MPRPYPPEFRFRAVALVRAGKPITTAATELGISAAALHNWVRQDQIDRGERPGIATHESQSWRKPTSASGNSRQRSRSSAKPRSSSGRTAPPQKGSPGDRFARRRRTPGQGLLPSTRGQQPRLLHVQDPPDVTDADASSVAHRLDPGGTRCLAGDLQGPARARRADPWYGRRGQRKPGRRADEARRHRRPTRSKVKRLKGVATADDLVHRKFHRLSPNELWVNDITEHPTREGKVYCCAVMDTLPQDRRLVDRQLPGLHPGRQCARHGHQEPRTFPRRDRARRPRGAGRIQSVVATPRSWRWRWDVQQDG